jgi:6-phosphogluconate dehydrogenase
LDVRGVDSLPALTGSLRTPRAVMMLVPAGAPVDAVLREIVPHLEQGDIIIDGGNSYFKDTDLRAKALAAKGILYLGVGISGGEHGARHGPSMMPGGPPEAYERVRPIFEAVAAQVDGAACVTYLGPGSAGHFVKMVHNGIEYGLMQLIAETYDLMKRGLHLTDDDLHAVYRDWNRAELSSYLLEITANIFSKVDDKTGQRLVDVILDAAKQKGTGMWTSQAAMELQVPAPTIDVAVAMRNLSGLEGERVDASRVLSGPSPIVHVAPEGFIDRLRSTFYTGMIITFAQGMALLGSASQSYRYDLRLENVARIWRGGCIIRAALLDEIVAAFHARPDLPNLLMDPHLEQEVAARQEDMRTVVRIAAERGIPVPGLMASLAYFDAYRSAWLPANLIQAQRDYFGAHTYERTDAKGVFHTHWQED